MVILAVVLAYLGANGRHLGSKLLQLGFQEASRWSLESIIFYVFLKLVAGIAGDPSKTAKMIPKFTENVSKVDPT